VHKQNSWYVNAACYQASLIQYSVGAERLYQYINCRWQTNVAICVDKGASQNYPQMLTSWNDLMKFITMYSSAHDDFMKFITKYSSAHDKFDI